jgi:hypothetical protein
MSGYCDHCNNTGWLNCYCGGDLCICDNQGETPCFHCEGVGADDGDDDYGPSYCTFCGATSDKDHDPNCGFAKRFPDQQSEHSVQE